MTVPSCDYCERWLDDPRGCEPGPANEVDPVIYGEELYPFSDGPACRDCSAPKGTMHHVECSCTECPLCHRQYHGSMTCAENRALLAGSTSP